VDVEAEFECHTAQQTVLSWASMRFGTVWRAVLASHCLLPGNKEHFGASRQSRKLARARRVGERGADGDSEVACRVVEFGGPSMRLRTTVASVVWWSAAGCTEMQAGTKGRRYEHRHLMGVVVSLLLHSHRIVCLTAASTHTYHQAQP